MQEFNLLDVKSLRNWVFVCTQNHFQEGATFFNHLKEQGNRVGCAIEPPEVITIESDRKDFFVRGIKKGLSTLGSQECFLFFCRLAVIVPGALEP